MSGLGYNPNSVAFGIQFHWVACRGNEFADVVFAHSNGGRFVAEVKVEIVDLLAEQHRSDAPAGDDGVSLDQLADSFVFD